MKRQKDTIKIQKNVAKAVIFSADRKKILILKNVHGYWDLPGGGVEFGETPEECIKREFYEETGSKEIIICAARLLQTIILSQKYAGGVLKKHYSATIFECALKANADIRNFFFRDDEVIDARWVSLSSVFSGRLRTPIFNKEAIRVVRDKKGNVRTRAKYLMTAGNMRGKIKK